MFKLASGKYSAGLVAQMEWLDTGTGTVRVHGCFGYLAAAYEYAVRIGGWTTKDIGTTC